MKKGLLCLGLASTLFATSCTRNFDDINSNPTAVSGSQYDPNYLLSRAQYSYANTGYSQLLFQSMWVQLLSSTFNYYSNGDKYVASSGQIGYQDRIWNEDYQAASYAYEMDTLAQQKSLPNLSNIGKIMNVLIMQHITDCYGDIPYSEALKGKAGTFTPAYDSQESIYTSMLTELQTAISALDESGTKPTADLFYSGDIAKWKKFGYSLMLRTAMRLVKVNPTLAQTWAEKAVAGGVFTSIADDAVVICDNSGGFSNGTTNALMVQDDYREVKWSKTLIDYMRKMNDPRLEYIAEIAPNGLAANNNTALAGSTDSSIQLGMPNGYDLNGGTTDITNRSDYPGATAAATSDDSPAPLGKYSRPTNALYRNYSGPEFVLTYAETELLLAEAAARGWSVGGTAVSHYAAGVTASMQSLATFSSDATISTTVATLFIAANPLDVTSTTASIKQINEQLWVTEGTLMNFIEAWNNWRRSGYPVLTPVVYTGNFTGGTIPRRIPYQSTENSTNPSGYASGVSSLSNGDTYTSRIWWDVAQ
ncbi:SusD/RagB family nutrient-binding outer membrane lipoprotein [Chitinophaga sancti]|uniref:SusD/RagB family nutrient-binding outer membrane lipoprotein n=1 Tax=Chitinophaga sancti TaxID=1004 RepID=UPI002A764A7E|nr:SusD/RagB family nutrient-binding outer membrane lipoprotein [Chitinophaga sancti]WPQ62610.1 SusD/RagB family nutrient-binding outer membrane lipoprotein [Chitinophaga sancti]